ncbi:MAG: 50S ribosomal protein L10 [Thermaerobacter sp.]|nr:50S ribosomal protein L10 [Thermaerobacter sp.]
MSTPEKEKTVADLTDSLRSAQSVVLADFKGLTVAQSSRLRRELGSQGVQFQVVKNTLLRKAAEHVGIEGLTPYLVGPTAIAISTTDLVAPAKVLYAFQRANKELQVKAGILTGSVIDGDQVKTLAELPPREVLLAKVAGGMKTPLYGLVSVISAPLRNLAYGVDALAKQRAQAG